MPDRLGDIAGSMASAAWSSKAMEAKVHFNHGYPRCGSPEAPENCQTNTLYGCLYYCRLGSSFPYSKIKD